MRLNSSTAKCLTVGVFALLLLAGCGGSAPVPRTVASLPSAQPEQRNSVAPTDLSAQLPAQAANDKDRQAETIVALMLPLSGADEAIGQALLRAATMALFDAYDPSLKLLPLDTEGHPQIAEVRAIQAIEAGASIVLGPLLSSNVRAVAETLNDANIPMLGFTNDSTAAGPGRFIMGFLPEAEVKRVVDYAVSTGHENFGALLPMGRYGERIRTAFGDTIALSGAQVEAIESYPPDPDALFEPVKRLARYDERRDDVRQEVRFLRALRDDLTDEIANDLEDAEVMEGVEFDAVLVPEGGALMRTLAPLLPFYEIDPNRVKLLGTGLWNDEGLLGEPPLQGAWFAAPDPNAPQGFLDRYIETYAEAAPRIATLAYDAMSLVALLARSEEPLAPASDDTIPDQPADNRFSADNFLRPEGFSGLDGLFRFLPDGTTERSLAILEVNRRGFQVIDPAPAAFPSFGYALKN